MSQNDTWTNIFYLSSVFLFAVSMPFSEFMISLSTGLLFISWIITGQFSGKWRQLKTQAAAILLISIFFVYVIGVFFTNDMALALYELKKTAFILIVPLCISTGPKIDYARFRKILFSFLVSLNIATLIAIFRLIFRTQLGIDEIWKILFVSHIGFTFQVLLGISIIINDLYNNNSLSKKIKYLLFADIIYLIVFLFVLKSLTGLGTLAILIVFHLFFVIWKIRNLKLKLLAILMLPLMLLGGITYIVSCYNRFYQIETIDFSHLPEKTTNGHLYLHDVSNKLLENGHYIGLFVCEEELKKSWEQRSSRPYNALDQTEFPTSATLIRYLTSKGLTKDSVGMSKMDQKDIAFVEKGIANYIYTERFWSLYPRIYQSIWELDVYFKTGNPNQKSLAKRIEFQKAAFAIIHDHPFFGVGTGNWKQAFYDAYQKNKSQLDPEEYKSSHNQYLNYLVKFGIVGFIWIIFAWTYPLFHTRKHQYYPAVMLVLIMCISNFSDSNLEAHMGISFFIFFYSFFLFSETKPLNN